MPITIPVTLNRTLESGYGIFEAAPITFPSTPNRTLESGYGVLESANFTIPVAPNRTLELGYAARLTGPFIRDELPAYPWVRVPTLSAIAFTVGTTRAPTVNQATLNVTLRNLFRGTTQAVMINGVYQVGFTGTITDISTALENLLRVSFTTDTPGLAESTWYQVEVTVSDSVPTALAPPDTWTFSTLPNTLMTPWDRSLGSNQARIQPLTRNAAGALNVVDGAHLLDGDFFVLRDGRNPDVRFEYDSNGIVTVGSIPITFNPFDVLATVVAETETAINGVGPALEISAARAQGALISLGNDRPGEQGNTVITEGVADAGFTVVNMHGGSLAGDVAGIPSAPEGMNVFCLGYQLPGLFHEFRVGDFSMVAQSADFSGARVVRIVAIVRPPVSLPGGVAWRLSLRIDGAERVARILTPGRKRRFVDLAANVTGLVGTHELSIRLELVSA